jgi:hypothetical protein
MPQAEQQIELQVLEVLIPGPPGAPGFGAGLPAITLDVEETNGNLTYTFTRNTELSRSLTVNYLVSGTGTNGAAIPATPAVVTFAPGAASAEVVITPRTGVSTPGNETFGLTLLAYYPSTSGAVTGTVFNPGDGTSLPSVNYLVTSSGDRIITISNDYLVLS